MRFLITVYVHGNFCDIYFGALKNYIFPCGYTEKILLFAVTCVGEGQVDGVAGCIYNQE